MPDFRISKEEIESLWQYAELQGGSKHRKAEHQALLDKVVARGPIEDFAEKPEGTIIVCPYCFAENPFSAYQVYGPCQNCGKGVFRRV
jgi:hypothetical protein